MTDERTKPENPMQGEGNYDAARRHRKQSEKFIQSHDTERLARDAAPRSEEEQRELDQAEEEGRSRSKTQQ